MTNRERINELPNEKFLEEVQKIASFPGFEFVDWEGWLNSDIKTPQYIGKPGLYQESSSDTSNWGNLASPGEFDDTEFMDCLILKPVYIDYDQKGYHIAVGDRVFLTNAVLVKYKNKEDEEQAIWPEPPKMPEIPKPSGPDDLENIW